MIDGSYLRCPSIGVAGGVVPLIVLGFAAFCLIKRRRRGGGTNLISPLQTQEAYVYSMVEPTWPVHTPTDTNLPYNPYDVSYPLFSYSIPSVSGANLPRHFVFPEP